MCFDYGGLQAGGDVADGVGDTRRAGGIEKLDNRFPHQVVSIRCAQHVHGGWVGERDTRFTDHQNAVWRTIDDPPVALAGRKRHATSLVPRVASVQTATCSAAATHDKIVIVSNEVRRATCGARRAS